MGRYRGLGQNENENAAPAKAIRMKDLPLVTVPQFIEFEPAANIAAGATGVVRYTMPVRDFVWAQLGFHTDLVGVPAARQRCRLEIRDIGSSMDFQPMPWLVSPIVGYEDGSRVCLELLPEQRWLFKAQTTVEVTFSNISGLPYLPTLIMGGWLEEHK